MLIKEIKGEFGFWRSVWLVLFLAWQLFMFYWLSWAVEEEWSPMDFIMLLLAWGNGSLFLGVFVLFTRRTRTMVLVEEEKVEQDKPKAQVPDGRWRLAKRESVKRL